MDNADVVSWAWYITRASALVGFFLLYISILFGSIGRIPIFRRFSAKICALNIHCWLSVQALIFALIHGVALIFDNLLTFSWLDVFVPFHSSYETTLVALGTISFYLILILVLTSYARKYISRKSWRIAHTLNLVLYGFSIVHALSLGTDMKNDLVRNIFIYFNVLLILILALNVYFRIKGRTARQVINIPQCDANIREGDAAGGQKRSREDFRRRI
ncbi:MAG: ferric reductase-like transmembrane domain-containing protein [Parcubacteria group bacterium]|jgi:predicted ferric reductase